MRSRIPHLQPHVGPGSSAYHLFVDWVDCHRSLRLHTSCFHNPEDWFNRQHLSSGPFSTLGIGHDARSHQFIQDGRRFYQSFPRHSLCQCRRTVCGATTPCAQPTRAWAVQDSGCSTLPQQREITSKAKETGGI